MKNIDKKVVIIGGEGNGGVVASCIEDNRKRYHDYEWNVIGFINDFEQNIAGYPVIGKLADIDSLIQNSDYFFVWAIHLVGRNYQTAKMFQIANIPDDRLATVIHNSAFIGKDASIGAGCLIMANSYVGPGAVIGKCSFIMANCSIGHNIQMGPLCHCSVGSIMTGYSKLGTCADIAVGATILAYKSVGDYSMLGAASLLTHDIPNGEIWVGTPAKFHKPMSVE